MLPLADRNPTVRTPVVTVLLILVNIGVFIFWQGGGTFSAQDDTVFTYEHAAIPCELVTGHPITDLEVEKGKCLDHPPEGAHELVPDKNVWLAALVSMFLHGGWFHLLGNMLFLWIFGNNIEDKLGPLRFLVFYLVGGLAATASQVIFDMNSVIPLVGASGAIAAVMGAYMVWFPSAPILTLVFIFLIEIPAGIWLTIWFVLQFFTGPNSGVAFMAHIGGFVFGLVVAAALRNTDWWKRRSLPAYRLLE
jgi:membrane associated rhomboid family serine protease